MEESSLLATQKSKDAIQQAIEDQVAIKASAQEEMSKQQRREYLKNLQEENFKTAHAMPIKREPVAENPVEKSKWGEEPPAAVALGAKDAPPSIYVDLNGRTFLTKILRVDESQDTQAIDQFIQTKMKVGKLQDNQENYERVFSNLLRRANLSTRQSKDYVIQKLGIYLSNLQKRYEDDDVDNIIVTLMMKGRNPNGSRRTSR